MSRSLAGWSIHLMVVCTVVTAAACGPGEAVTAQVAATGQAKGALEAVPTQALFDAARRTPACASVAAGCDSGTLLNGRGALGPERDAPNTFGALCHDGSSGRYGRDESLEQLVVLSEDGGELEAGKRVHVRTTVYVRRPSSDLLDLYVAADAAAPTWTLLATLSPASSTGLQTLSTSYVLPDGARQAVRGVFRYGGSAAPCGTGSYTDNDELAFAVAPRDLAPTVALTSPAPDAQLAGAVQLSAAASDERGVARVEFFAGAQRLGADDVAPFTATWDTRTVANGTYALTAIAHDSTGHASSSAALSVTVENDVTGPELELLAPVPGAVTAGQVELEASASDTGGLVELAFHVDGTLQCEVALAGETTAQRHCAWSGTSGTHAVQVTARDAAGNTTSTEVSFIADATAPAVAITQPVAGARVQGAVRIEVDAADTGGVASVELLVDGAPAGRATSAPFLFTWDSRATGNGGHMLQARATDMLGNVATSAAVSVTVDNDVVAPSVSLEGPGNGNFVGDHLYMSAQAKDTRGLAHVEFWVDGAFVEAQRAGGAVSGRYDLRWNASAATEGAHLVLARAYDLAGNVGVSETVQFVVDHTWPSLAVLSPATGAVLSGTATVRFHATDASGIRIVKVYLIGDNYFGGDSSKTDTVLLDTTQVTNGAYTVRVLAEDLAGNVTEAEPIPVQVSNDRSPPEAHLALRDGLGNWLEDGHFASGTVQVSGFAQDDVTQAVRLSLWLDGRLVATSEGEPQGLQYAWNTRESGEGSHTLELIAVDDAGKQASVTRTAIVRNDYAAPQLYLAFSDPTAGGSSIEGSQLHGLVDITASAWDELAVARVELLIDGVQVASVDGPDAYLVHRWDTRLTPDGVHLVEARAFDTTGKSASSVHEVLLVNDAHVPHAMLALRDPSSGMEVYDREVRWTLDVDFNGYDRVGLSHVELFLDGVLLARSEAPPGGGNHAGSILQWDTRTVSDGSHTLEVRAYDTAGRVGTTARTVTVANDHQSPSVSLVLVDPLTGEELTSGTLRGAAEVRGTAYDDVSVVHLDLSIDGQLVQSATRSADEPPNGMMLAYLWETTAVADGLHTLQLRAEDGAGRVTVLAYPIAVQNSPDSPPTPYLVKLTDGAVVNHYTRLEVAAVYGSQPTASVVRTDFHVDGEPVASLAPHQGYTYWSQRWASSGTHTVFARVHYADGSALDTPTVSVVVEMTPIEALAQFDPARGAPGCATPGASCDSGRLLVGQGLEGAEPHAPNTLSTSSCADAAAVGFHTTPTIDAIHLHSWNGAPLSPGQQVSVYLDLWLTDWSDAVDVYLATDADQPHWTHVASVEQYGTGQQGWVYLPITLPSAPAGTWAVRAVVRSGALQACDTEGDHDDLFFVTQ